MADQRYLCGSTFTASDIRLFVTLIRFDAVYAVYFKANKRLIREYPNLYNYTKDVYQRPGIAETVNMKHIKGHYYSAHPTFNTYGIIPVGKEGNSADIFNEAHNRDRFE